MADSAVAVGPKAEWLCCRGLFMFAGAITAWRTDRGPGPEGVAWAAPPAPWPA